MRLTSNKNYIPAGTMKERPQRTANGTCTNNRNTTDTTFLRRFYFTCHL
jgi:hypothetical protein